MSRALRAEWRKARTVRTIGLLLGGVILVEVIFKGLLAALQPLDAFDRPGQYQLLAPTLFLAFAAAVAGVLISGQEWRYRLATPTFLAIPNRTQVLAAKGLVAASLAASTGLAATGTANAICGIVLDRRATALVAFGDELITIFGTAAACGLLALGGVALGILVRSQAAAIGVAAIVLLVLAPLTFALAPEIASVLPYGASLALALQERADPTVLGPAPGALVLTAEITLLAALATRTLRRTDAA